MIIKRNELLINAKTWLNLKIVFSEGSHIHTKRVHMERIYSCKTLENANESMVTENVSGVAWEEGIGKCGRKC